MMKQFKQLPLFILIVEILLAACGRSTPTPTAVPPTETSPSAATQPETSQSESVVDAAVPDTLPRIDINPTNFAAVVDNPYLPRIPGSRYVYEGQTEEGFERTELEVLQETKVILGIPTTIVRDTVYLDGELIEDTYDWFAQDTEGNIWYFGEDVSNYENGRLVDKAGSWEAGVDGALPGILMYADPEAHVGETYLQEYYAGEAEDTAKILSTGESVDIPYGSFEDVVKTYEFTPLDPAAQEYKFFAPGIGKTHDLDLTTGNVMALVEYVPARNPLLDLPVAPESARVDLGVPTFSNPTEVTNPLFPYSQTDQIILLGHVEGQPLYVVYTLLPDTQVIEWNGQQVETIAVQYLAYINGRIVEYALDWYAQADDGSVWYFGEDVYNYEDGVVADTHGTWLVGRDGPLAMIMPANPQVGDVYRVENIPGLVFEEITVKATNVTIQGPNGPISGAMIGEQLHMDGEYSNKTFAPGYGEFATIKGSELEAVALAVPTDARPGPTPVELETLSTGAAAIFDAAQSGDWSAAAAALETMIAAWDVYQAGDGPLMLDAQMSEVLTSLLGAVNTRQPIEARYAALAVAQASLDLQLQYRPSAEIDLARFVLWTQQILVDVEAGEPGWVKSDGVTLELIRDRMAHTLDNTVVSEINAYLDYLRAAADEEDLEATAEVAAQLQDLLATLQPTN